MVRKSTTSNGEIVIKVDKLCTIYLMILHGKDRSEKLSMDRNAQILVEV